MYVASIQFLSEFAIQAITKPSADPLKPVCHTRGFIQMFEVFEKHGRNWLLDFCQRDKLLPIRPIQFA